MARNQGRILVIDDNEDILLAIRYLLQGVFETVKTVRNPNRIPALLREEDWDVYVLDMNFRAGQTTGNEGMYWMQEILKLDPAAVIILITAYGDVKLAVEAMKKGATDFITKPWEDEKFLSTLQTAYKLRRSNKELSQVKEQKDVLQGQINSGFRLVTGDSPAMKKVYQMIAKVAKTDANILILGENGTGKEVIAREVHHQSGRSGNIFMPVDLGSLSNTLFESELFGYKKGSFTGAMEDRKGKIEVAYGGSLFLDEIGNLDMALQSKLLTVLQNKKVTPIGSSQAIPVDFRLICATNQPLYNMVDDGEFREDLLYRINTIQIELPPLRQRQEDIPVLAQFFLQKFASKYKREIHKIDASAIQKLKKHSWPGNIRELEHVIEKAVILSEGNQLTNSDFYFNDQSVDDSPDTLNLEENEIRLLRMALRKNDDNVSEAARELGISRKTMYNKMKKYEL